MNEVRVLLFARARELAGRESLSLQLPDGARVADVRAILTADQPALRILLTRCAVSINGQYAADQQAVPSGAELAILPPVSGGSR